MKGCITLVAVLAFVVLIATPGHAQVTGDIRGTVVDQSGGAIPGATINVMSAGGEKAIFTAVTNAEGTFSVPSVPSLEYDVVAESKGFQSQKVTSVKVDPGRDTVLPPFKLQVQTVRQSVDVVANSTAVETSESVVASTITNAQFQRLPMIDRSPLALINSQAGVSQARGPTVINGQRTSYANVTLDGINIQDNFLRENSLNFLPNLLLADQVAEVTITTANGSVANGFGGAQVSFVTPSGSNNYSGSLYWYNRNSALAANDWFNNRDGIKKPALNQNQIGGTLGGPVFRDKLMFYTNYELFRLRQKAASDRTILTADARQGIFTYRDTGGTVRKVNILQAMNVSADPTMASILARLPSADQINQFRTGDSSETLLRNTAGYSFLRTDNRTRDNVLVKLDYHLSTDNSFAGTYTWNRDINERPDVNALGYTVKPPVFNDGKTNLLSIGWRWSPSARLTNELRGGFNLAPGPFVTTEEFGKFLIATPLISNPVNTFRAQGRNTRTYNTSDTASWSVGPHSLQFGFQTQNVRTAPYDDLGITPTYTLGIGTGNTGLAAAQLPGISPTDLANANALLALLGGYVTSDSQTFNVNNRTSGFVSGAQSLRHFRFDQYGFFVQDKWRVRPGFTVTGGLRYDLFGVVDERDSLALLPVIVNNDPKATLLSNATLDFAGKSAGRPWYKKDYLNFAPSLGIAWDVFGDGKAAVRAAYGLFYVNDQFIYSIQNSAATAGGLSSVATASGLTGRISTGLPAITTPPYKVPRTVQDNYATNTQAAIALPDPNLSTPYTQQWNFALEYDLKHTLITARYLGNHSTGSFRGFDYNQVVIVENGFLDDFNRALANGNLSRAATGVFNPAYTGPGTQPLTVFPKLVAGGLLTNSTIVSLIQQGQPGELAATYQVNALQGSVNFFRNPYSLGTNIFSNAANSNYHALQLEVRRQRGPLDIGGNYTFSKALSNTTGTNQANFEALLDNANPQLEKGRVPYDLTHAFKVNAVYDLPAGKDHRLSFGPLNRVLGGWSISSILNWQSGVPFSINSARGTVNRAARSGPNTANSTLNHDQLDDIVQFRMTPTGPYIIAASAIGADGRGVAPDGSAPFTGQVFFHPAPGTNGTLERRMFNGPSVFNMDFSLMKKFQIREKDSVEVRMEAANVFNNVTWNVGDQTISSTNFGKITGTFYDRRLIQLSMHYRF